MKIKGLFTCSLAAALLLTGCSSSNTASGKGSGTALSSEEADSNSINGLDTSKTVKIGVLVSDATSAEALSFRRYYEDYIQNVYNVEFIYSDELKDASGEKSAVDNMITNNAKAVISFSSFDRAAQIEQCADAGIYYSVATGTLSDEEYETYKSEPTYVGAIGPTLDVEFETGYNMAKYYLDQGDTEFAIFGGAVPYYTDMHIYRVAGMLKAMVDASGADYKGAREEADIVAQIYQDGAVETGDIGDIHLLGYVGGYDMDDAWFGKCAETVQIPGLQVMLCVGNGSDFFATAARDTEVRIASVDAYAESYGEAMSGGSLDYLAGKFSASIGPIFAATYSAVLGAPIRDEEGNALALSQGYWIATSADEFNEFYAVDSSTESPAYTKGDLDTLIGADYDTFASFVSAYSFEDISK